MGLSQPWTPLEIITNLEQMAQTWEKLLFSSGGALELSKCFYCIIAWKWIDRIPRMMTIDEMPTTQILLTAGYSLERTGIKQHSPEEAHTSLGVWMTPTGGEEAQLDALLEKSNRMAVQVMTSKLNRTETHIASWAVWLPALTYSLGTTTIPVKQLQWIQSKATGTFLAKLGINRHFPRAVTFGPEEYGGLQFCNLVVEHGSGSGVVAVVTFI